jgi:hypothetical protein
MKAAEKLAAQRARAAGPFAMASVLDRHAATLRAEMPPTQVALIPGGARSNNMAPPKYIGPQNPPVRILHQGIDSIWLNIYGQIKEEWPELLAWAKEDAQNSDSERADSPLPPFDGAVPEMWSTGLPYYEWHLSSLDVDVSIRKPSKRSRRAAATIRVSAECLWRMGDGGFRATLLAAAWLMPLFDDRGYRVQVGRAHIASDFQGYSPELADMLTVVKRAGDEAYIDDGEEENSITGHRNRANRLTGISAGKSNNVRLNLYDKVLQVRQKGLTWVRDLWDRCEGYISDAEVWRAEFQFGREFLRDRKIETIDDLREKIGGLWADGLRWYSFRTPSGDTNRSRWSVAGWWSALSTWQSKDAGELPKVKVVRPKWERIAKCFAGYAATAMAITGINDPAAALVAAIEAAEAAHDPLRYVDGGHLRYSRESWPMMERKLAAKRRQYQGFTMAG